MILELEPQDLETLAKMVADRVLAVIDDRQRIGQNGGSAAKVSFNEAEAAQAIGISRWSLRDLRLQGKIKPSRGKKPILYSHADLLAALEYLRNQ